MKEHINSPCNTSLALSYDNGTSSDEEREVRGTSVFAESDGVVGEGALDIDNGAVKRSASLDPPFAISFDAAEREGVECVRRALEQLVGEVLSGTEPGFDADGEGEVMFVEVVGGGQKDDGAMSESFTFADALTRANMLSETILEGIVSLSDLFL